MNEQAGDIFVFFQVGKATKKRRTHAIESRRKAGYTPDEAEG
jgi:hypothetical protein